MMMKKVMALIAALTLMMTACFALNAQAEAGKTLVVYFSATGNTQAVADIIVQRTGADVLALEARVPYTDEDLDWTNEKSRVSVEHGEKDAVEVELVEASVDNWAEYDTVFVGFPIWWHEAAWPVNTFIRANDFTGKTVIPFCTSSASDLGDSGKLLAQMAGTGEWLEGVRFSSRVAEDEVNEWLDSLALDGAN